MAATQPSESKYLRTEQLADELFVKRDTVYRWRQKGFGPPFVRVGGQVLYRREDVDAWVAQQVEQPAAATG